SNMTVLKDTYKVDKLSLSDLENHSDLVGHLGQYVSIVHLLHAAFTGGAASVYAQSKYARDEPFELSAVLTDLLARYRRWNKTEDKTEDKTDTNRWEPVGLSFRAEIRPFYL